MIFWLIIIAGYSLLAVRLIWAIQITRETTAISRAKLAARIIKASELMLDQQVIAVQADKCVAGFQVRKTITSDRRVLLEAIIPFTGSAQAVKSLVQSYEKDYTILHCKSLKSVDGALIIDVTTEKYFLYFLHLFQTLFSVPQASKYVISKAYLLDARQPLRTKISRFTNECFFLESESICKMLSPSSADLFQSETPPHIHANKIYLLAAKKNTVEMSHD